MTVDGRGPGREPEAIARRHRWVSTMQVVGALATPTLAVAATAAAWLAYGRRGLITPIIGGVLMTVPGDLIRRALGLRWPSSSLGIAAANIALSMGALVVVGSPLLLARSFTQTWIITALIAGAAAAAIPISRRPLARSGLVTSVAITLVVVAVFAIGMLTLELRPYVGSRISLGQYEGVVMIANAGEVPERALAFDTDTDFPIHYLFFDIVVGSILLVGSHDLYSEQLQLLASLRVVFLALFGVGWYLAGRVFLRSVLGVERTWNWIAAVLPLLLVLNRVVYGKYREPLTEGLGVAVIGVGLWALITTTDGDESERLASAVVGAVALGLLPGISLPALAGAAFLIGSWVIVTTVSRSSARSTGETSPVSVLRSSGWGVAIGPIVGLVLYDRIGRGALSDLLGGSIESAATNPGQSFQAGLMLVGRHLSNETPREAVASAAGSANMFVSGAAWLVVVALGVIAALSITRWRPSRWRWLGWLVGTIAVLLAYTRIGVLFAGVEVTPWRTMTRSAFYVWVPVAMFLLIGLGYSMVRASRAFTRGGDRPPRRTRALGIAAGLVAFVAGAASLPTLATATANVRDHGWILTSQLSDPGHATLRWISKNLPEIARLMTSEITYGSALVAERHVVTEGKGTVEDSVVTAATIEVIGGAIEFFLPARDPRVLSELAVDYLVAPSEGVYRKAHLGGRSMLRSMVARVRRAEAVPLADLPYLSVVHVDGDVVVYQVDLTRLSDIQDDGFHNDRSTLAGCRTKLCIAHLAAPVGGCSRTQISSSRDYCILTRTNARSAINS